MSFFKKSKIIFLFLLLFSYLSSGLFASGAIDEKIDVETLIKNDSESEIKEAIKKYRNLIDFVSEKEKNNLLHLAIINNRDLSIVKMLLSFDISSETKNAEGATALMLSCKYSSVEVVRELLFEYSLFAWQRKNKALRKDNSNRNCFDYANGRPEIISFLEEQTNYVVKKDESFFTYDNFANGTKSSENEELANAHLKDKNVLPNQSNLDSNLSEDDSSLVNDSNNSLLEKSEIDLEADFSADVKKNKPVYLFDLEEIDTLKTSELKDAVTVEGANFSTVQTINSLHDAISVDKNGCTHLMKASATGDVFQMYNLIQAGADVNAQDKDGWTVAMYCIRYSSNSNALKLLKENGADFLKANSYSVTPLILASEYSDNADIFKQLLENRSYSEREVRQAFINAICFEKPCEVLQVFLDLNLPLNQMYVGGKTPLMYACQNNLDTKIIDFLLKNGADYKIRTKDGKNAFYYASKNKKLKKDDVYWFLNNNGDY